MHGVNKAWFATPDHPRKSGLDYDLKFISETNPGLRKLVKAIHNPKVVYKEP